MYSTEATTSEPVYTLLAIPALAEDKSPGYLRLIHRNTKYCRPLMKIPASQIQYTSDAVYMLDTPEKHRPSWDVLLLEVGNAHGMQNHSPDRSPTTKAAFMLGMQTALDQARRKEGSTTLKLLRACRKSAQHYIPASPTELQASHKPGAYIRKKAVDTAAARPAATTHTTPLPTHMHMAPPLRYRW